MLDTLKRLWSDLYTRIGLIIIVTIALVWILRKTQLAWGSFLIAFTIAYVSNPFLRWCEAYLKSRVLGVIVVMITMLGFVGVGVWLLSTIMLDLTTLPNRLNIDALLLNLTTPAEDPSKLWIENLWLVGGFFTWLRESLGSMGDTIMAGVQESLRSFALTLQNEWSTTLLPIFQQFLRGIGGIIGIVLQAGLVLVMTSYLLPSYPRVMQSLLRMFPPRQQPLVRDLAEKFDLAVGGYLRAKVIEALIVGIVTWLVLEILQVPSSLALAFIALVLNPIPYLGPTLATIPVVIMAFIGEPMLTLDVQGAAETGISGLEITSTHNEAQGNITRALVAGGAMLVIQQLDGNFLGPLLLAQTVRIHPVAVLLALLIGSSLFGFWGVLLAIPATAFLQLIYNDYYLTSAWYNRNVDTSYKEYKNSSGISVEKVQGVHPSTPPPQTPEE